MILSILLKNFQSHSSKKLELTPGTNIITGSSDTGKSAIIRAVEWLRTNRPRGTSFIRNGQDEARVVIRTEKGKVKRFRTKTENGYEVNNERLVAVGTGVPPSVFDVLGLSDINVQMQHDPPFLLTQSPGEIGKALNQYADLSEVDSILQELNKRSGANKRELQSKESEAQSVRQSLVVFQNLPYLEGVLSAVGEATSKIQANQQKCSDVETCLARIDKHRASVKSYAKVPAVIEKSDKLKESVNSLREQEQKIRDLSWLLESISSHMTREQVVLPSELPQVIESNLGRVKALGDKIERLMGCITTVEGASRALREATEELKKMPDVGTCPTCGTVIKIEGEVCH